MNSSLADLSRLIIYFLPIPRKKIPILLLLSPHHHSPVKSKSKSKDFTKILNHSECRIPTLKTFHQIIKFSQLQIPFIIDHNANIPRGSHECIIKFCQTESVWLVRSSRHRSHPLQAISKLISDCQSLSWIIMLWYRSFYCYCFNAGSQRSFATQTY